ncbi:MAG: DUF3696 domain-containing protein [Gammaproteobacteria bacterium]|nr:DUF3696 domain-containing protein [Gammaproteobacteria bacterium]
MITRIDLRHFKCFDTLKLPLQRLTLLAGLNASGKSSVLQALVLLHQTIREHEWSERLLLNGTALRLGAVRDVIDHISGGRELSLAVEDEGTGLVAWELTGEQSAMSLTVRQVRVPGFDGAQWVRGEPTALHNMLPLSVASAPAGGSLVRRLRGLTWLAAERLGPRDIYVLDDSELPLVGEGGESAASVLYSGADDRVAIPLLVEKAPPTLLRQVEARMSEFFPGFEMDITPVARANAVTLGVRTSRDTDFHRPGHTGFGITQVLPIVVAVLAAKPDDLVLIENPEVHLHPAGQSRMGGFLADAANAGVQVLVESHSDHVLNGVRRAVKQGRIDPNATALYYFRPRHEAEASGVAQVESPAIDADGNIADWPAGFFDQFDHDMSYLAGWS